MAHNVIDVRFEIVSPAALPFRRPPRRRATRAALGAAGKLGFRDVSPPGEKPVIKEFGLVR